MTLPPIPDPQTDRPSTAMLAVAHSESVLNTIASKLAALVGLVVFSHLTWLETKSAMPSNVRLGLVSVPAVLCLAMLCTDQMVSTIKGVGGALSPFLPAKFGGKS